MKTEENVERGLRLGDKYTHTLRGSFKEKIASNACVVLVHLPSLLLKMT